MSADATPEIIKPQPTPFTTNISKAGTATLPSGDTVDLIRILLFTVTGTVELYCTAPDAIGIADTLRTNAGGLHIAHSLEGRTL